MSEHEIRPDDLEINEELWDDFKLCAEWLLEIWDIDPMYPLLKGVYNERNLTTEQSLWYTFMYVDWYWLHSTEHVYQRHPHYEDTPTGGVDISDDFYTRHCRKERRCVRGNDAAAKFLNWVIEQGREYTLEGWIEKQIEPYSDPKKRWRALRDAFSECPYAGGWCEYKLCDLLKYTHDYDITADDMGTGAGSDIRGPIAGIELMTNFTDTAEVLASIDTQFAMLDYCLDAGIPYQGIEQLETTLCNYTSTTRGYYYIGSDLDDMMEQLDDPIIPQAYWDVRQDIFPDRHLGELHGWHGKSQRLRTLYRDYGILEWWKLSESIDEQPTNYDPDEHAHLTFG